MLVLLQRIRVRRLQNGDSDGNDGGEAEKIFKIGCQTDAVMNIDVVDSEISITAFGQPHERLLKFCLDPSCKVLSKSKMLLSLPEAVALEMTFRVDLSWFQGAADPAGSRTLTVVNVTDEAMLYDLLNKRFKSDPNVSS